MPLASLLTKGANTRYHLHLSLSDPGTFRHLSANGDKAGALTAVFRIFRKTLLHPGSRATSTIPVRRNLSASDPSLWRWFLCTLLCPCLYISTRRMHICIHTITIVNSRSFVNSHLPSGHLFFLEYLQEHLHQVGIKLGAGTAAQLRLRCLPAHGLVVRSVVHHHIVGVHHRDNAG